MYLSVSEQKFILRTIGGSNTTPLTVSQIFLNQNMYVLYPFCYPTIKFFSIATTLS